MSSYVHDSDNPASDSLNAVDKFLCEELANSRACTCGQKSYEQGSNTCEDLDKHDRVEWVNKQMTQVMPWFKSYVIDDFHRDTFVERHGDSWTFAEQVKLCNNKARSTYRNKVNSRAFRRRSKAALQNSIDLGVRGTMQYSIHSDHSESVPEKIDRTLEPSNVTASSFATEQGKLEKRKAQGRERQRLHRLRKEKKLEAQRRQRLEETQGLETSSDGYPLYSDSSGRTCVQEITGKPSFAAHANQYEIVGGCSTDPMSIPGSSAHEDQVFTRLGSSFDPNWVTDSERSPVPHSQPFFVNANNRLPILPSAELTGGSDQQEAVSTVAHEDLAPSGLSITNERQIEGSRIDSPDTAYTSLGKILYGDWRPS
ncbi:hypothetical protein FFLO_02621 [Filobasidium floriforme]|uniref:Uncharacterized protein n=1 Tax=Filobasidium floriforme TaxID=5210 RepID=A0A8K0JMN6_9TREE|nr:uncharacterized protein HD553DRAFT_322956 [Filobasidium floriforme]KAG7561981.1 hypothetical protein FFLO_02621 [Filobasidium floriforme]KAH8087482.1 hypothetical protein HD553DRAFT_322956 [Filobasidium floriforme]